MNRLPFPDKIAAFIARHQLFAPGDRVAVAVSGGADSVALLRALLELRGPLGIVLLVAHFDHKIRPESSAEAEFVRALAAAHDLEFLFSEGDTPAVAPERSVSLETAARDLRYAWFASAGMPMKIATAHTLDDQAETVLMKLLRGAGTKGLSGIWPRLELGGGGRAVLRPMLEARHADAIGYLKALGQAWHEDASNQDTRHTRNKVRHDLLPLLERDYNPNVMQVLACLAEVARADEDYWGEEVLRGRATARTPTGEGLSIKALNQLPLALRRRVLREVFRRASGLTLDFEHTDGLLRFLQSRDARECFQLPQHWQAVVHRKLSLLCFELRVPK